MARQSVHDEEWNAPKTTLSPGVRVSERPSSASSPGPPYFTVWLIERLGHRTSREGAPAAPLEEAAPRVMAIV